MNAEGDAGARVRDAGVGSIDAATELVDSGAARDPVVDISAGNDFTCVLRSSGAVQCLGSNGRGELGGGFASSGSAAPVRVLGLDDAVSIDTGAESGANAWGQLGTDPRGTPCMDGQPGTYCSHTPVTVPGVMAAEVVAGLDFTCARRSSGAVSCWGAADLVGTSDGGRYCTLDAMQPLTPYGGLPYGELLGPCIRTPVAVSGLDDAVEITGKYFHACARRRSGTLACWGYDGWGEIGDGTTHTYRAVPTPVTVF